MSEIQRWSYRRLCTRSPSATPYKKPQQGLTRRSFISHIRSNWTKPRLTCKKESISSTPIPALTRFRPFCLGEPKAEDCRKRSPNQQHDELRNLNLWRGEKCIVLIEKKCNVWTSKSASSLCIYCILRYLQMVDIGFIPESQVSGYANSSHHSQSNAAGIQRQGHLKHKWSQIMTIISAPGHCRLKTLQ